jgi:hypothetical protein
VETRLCRSGPEASVQAGNLNPASHCSLKVAQLEGQGTDELAVPRRLTGPLCHLGGYPTLSIY